MPYNLLKMKWIRYLLLPIVPLYFTATWIRNFLYNIGLKESKSYPIPVICVGNLSTGGTGKTPMIEYLIRLLKDEKRLATLSRGYKRQTQGYLLANEQATSQSIGDEPFQFYQKFKNSILVAVDANRQNGIENLIKNKVDLILLDDAYQHRKVKAGFNILLTSYHHLYVKDLPLPTGNLREPKSGAKRAQVIVVTKCPENLSEKAKNDVIKLLKPKPNQKVFFSNIQYADSVFSKTKSLKIKELPKFCLVTGIANPKPLVEFLRLKGLQFEHFNYPDHYHFKDEDLRHLKAKSLIITTEKDFTRLAHHEGLNKILYYLPIQITLDQGELFDIMVNDFVNFY